MKQPTGKLVKPFSFTDTQRNELMRAWKRPADRKKAESFIGSSEKIVENWLSIAEDQRATIPEARDYATHILKATNALQVALGAPPEDVVMILKMCVDERLYVTEYRREHEEVASDLKALFPGQQYPSLFELAEVLESWLDLLQKSFEKLAVAKASSGMDKRTEKWLVDMLSNEYEQHFCKPPSASNGSSFRKFASALSGVINRDLGADIVREVLKKPLPFAPEK